MAMFYFEKSYEVLFREEKALNWLKETIEKEKKVQKKEIKKTNKIEKKNQKKTKKIEIFQLEESEEENEEEKNEEEKNSKKITASLIVSLLLQKYSSFFKQHKFNEDVHDCLTNLHLLRWKMESLENWFKNKNINDFLDDDFIVLHLSLIDYLILLHKSPKEKYFILFWFIVFFTFFYFFLFFILLVFIIFFLIFYYFFIFLIFFYFYFIFF